MAKIHNYDKTFIKYKNMLFVHERPVEFKQNTLDEKTVPLSACCDKGEIYA